MKFLKIGTIHKNLGRQYTRVEVAVWEAISDDATVKREEYSFAFQEIIDAPEKCAECVEARFKKLTGQDFKVNTQANVLRQFKEAKS